MKNHALIGLLSAATLGFFAVSAPAMATPISQTISLNQVFAGNTPDGTPPWLTATFTAATGSTTGTLTLTSNLSASDFLQGLSSPNATVGWAFYLNQSVSSLSCLSGNCANGNSGFNAITVDKHGHLKGGFNTGPVPGGFNLGFGWDVSSRFMAGSKTVYDLTFSSALTGNPFVDNASNWMSVAHVQGITGGCSGWIVAGSGTASGGEGPCTVTHSVPEPAELPMFGFGVLLVGAFIGLRRRFS